MYKYLNLHPKEKLVSDCVKRAFAKTENRPYQEISLELNRQKKITKVDDFNNMKNVECYLRTHGYVKRSFPAVKGEPRMNGKRFMESHSTGTYILRMAGHIVACENGNIYDTWDCTEKCVYVAWEKMGGMKC